MSGHVAKVAAVVAVLLGAAAPGAADRLDPSRPAERTDRIDQARTKVLDSTYQAELPRHQTASAGSGDDRGVSPRPRRQAGGELGDSARERRMMIDVRDHQEQGAMSSLMTFLLWGMVIVIGVLIAFWIGSELSR